MRVSGIQFLYYFFWCLHRLKTHVTNLQMCASQTVQDFMTSHGLIAKEAIEEIEAGGWILHRPISWLTWWRGDVDCRTLPLPWCNRSSLGCPAWCNQQHGGWDCVLSLVSRRFVRPRSELQLDSWWWWWVIWSEHPEMAGGKRRGCDAGQPLGGEVQLKYRSFSSHLPLWSWAASRQELRLRDTDDFHWFCYKMSWEYHVHIESRGAQKILL